MRKKDFKSLKRGLEQARDFIAGDHSLGTIHTPEDIEKKRDLAKKRAEAKRKIKDL